MTLSYPKTAAQQASAQNRIGRFYITRELGRGSTGTVYLAHDPVIDREVAIKTFSSDLSPFEKKHHQQQLINEARAAGRLSHTNIVTIYEASSEGNATYIAMEYLQGRELNRLLDRGYQFSNEDIAVVIRKIAKALDYAHKAGVIHRVIKPANIFMVGNLRPKIVDFGIARAPNRTANAASEAQDNIEQPFTIFDDNIIGTPNYMSPEQAQGRDADERTDIYSLGAVMYEMLVLRKPFQAAGTDELLQLIINKSPTAPHEVNSEVPRELSKIVMKAMHKRPEKRYQTAAEMGRDLKNFIAKEWQSSRQKNKNLVGKQPLLTKKRSEIKKIILLAGSAAAGIALIFTFRTFL